ncbi:MAG: hypothetical protein M3M94_03275 [Actinomycetota bacterium]|nr:hypothetical protein [Actinomycetota bacterium]
MRRIFLVLATAGALVPAALSAPAEPGDGTLSVVKGRGTIWLDVRGVVIGQLDAGNVTVIDPEEERGSEAEVRGAERTMTLSDTKKRWRGDDLRFRLVGGDWRLRVHGRGIDLSVVGRGTVKINGAGDNRGVANDGKYSLNDASYDSLPDRPKTLKLAP